MTNSTTQQYFAILFADVAGSTRLYEKIGDRAAREAISGVLGRMTAIAEHHSGVLVKTIGDEILCRFPDAERAVSAAIAMQETLCNDSASPVRLQMRMGLHWGPVILEQGDVFGDAVNVAARMSAVARAGQIITTRDTVLALPPELAERTRLFDTATVKGKQDSMVMYEVLWEEDGSATMFIAAAPAAMASAPAVLRLRYQGREIVLAAGEGLSIGRGDSAELVVASPLASRLHARIECRRGKFVFIDQSTNGSHVRREDGSCVYLRREELPLVGQ
ncbi:MAG: adenylate/guanylate cyclase domain-containing protein, partial [Moraxellaceae bacterium]